MAVVYSTEKGRVCPGCGWPAADCKCSSRNASASVPDRVIAKLRLEKKGRGGKSVSVIYDLPDNAEFLKTLCQDLKRACSVGGAVIEGGVELQGDQRERLRALLQQRGYIVKG